MPETKSLSISSLKIDGGTQPRSEIDESVVCEYAEAMREGAEFPPVVVFFDGASHWLADGFHRTHAARRAKLTEIAAEIHDGTKRDAILYSVGANHGHGLRRTNTDKRKAVMTLLEDEEWGQWSNMEIARQCAVSDEFVRQRRASLPTVGSEPPRTYTSKHGTKATMNTENIGKRKAPQVTDKNGVTRKSAQERETEIREMAEQGFRSDQIGDKIELSAERVREMARKFDIELADNKIGRPHRIDDSRVIEQTVTGLEGYASGLAVLSSELSEITAQDAADWVESLAESLKTINKLKRKLTEIVNNG